MNDRAHARKWGRELGLVGPGGWRGSRVRGRGRRPGSQVEILEDRRLLSTLDITSGALQYDTTSGASGLTIEIIGTTLFFIDEDQTITLGSGATADGWGAIGGVADGPASSVSSMLIGGNSSGRPVRDSRL